MPEQSPILSLPYIQPSQAQKHVTHNEALRRLDILVQLVVQDRDRDLPPSGPQEGDRHIVAIGAGGAWSGQDGNIAVYENGNWSFIVPASGWRAHVLAEAKAVVHDGGDWVELSADLSDAALQNLTWIGVNTSADTVNRLAVSAEATLLTHAGAGHQLKINKNDTGDTGSLLFQTGWSGRAEMGLSGEDNFAVKVSADGSTWNTAMRIEGADGRVTFPSGGARSVVSGQTTWYVDPVLGNDVNDGLAPGVGAFASLHHAVSVLSALDGNGTTARIQLADGTHTLASSLILDRPLVGFTEFEIVGDAVTPANVTLSGSSAELIMLATGALSISGVTLTHTGSGSMLRQANGTILRFSAVDFGACNRFHIENDGGHVEIEGDYSISGGAQLHLKSGTGGQVIGANFAVALTGTPNFSLEFILAMDNSVISLWNPTYTGAATGMRYLAVRGGIINTYGKGASFLPGDAAGSVATNGQYL